MKKANPIHETPATQDCIKCLSDHGKKWGSTSESDLQEGICPLYTTIESYSCKTTGRKLIPQGVIKIALS